jgi:hypothetical protein
MCDLHRGAPHQLRLGLRPRIRILSQRERGDLISCCRKNPYPQLVKLALKKAKVRDQLSSAAALS